jgi:aldose 1-epimerase
VPYRKNNLAIYLILTYTEGVVSKFGKLWTIALGDQVAVIAQKGATLVSYQKAGLDIIAPFDPNLDRSPAFNGAILAPWPNRIEGGKYTFAGQIHQLPINEPELGNALHGLVYAKMFDFQVMEPERVVLTLEQPGQVGYPWTLLYDVMYKLTPIGLKTVIRVTNRSDAHAPFGIGWHPWLTPNGDLDDSFLYMKAQNHLKNNPNLIPIAQEPTRYPYNFNKKTSLINIDLDDGFTGFERGIDQRAKAFFTRTDNRQVEVWMDLSYRSFQICSADHLNGLKRFALAVEPMSCPANAFNTKDDLIVLEPGEKRTFKCGIHVLPH